MSDFFTLHLGNNTYRSSQFIIRLDGYVELENFEDSLHSNPSLYSLFLHEYIHFLQDVTTRYGIMKAANIYGYTSQLAYYIRKSDSNTFTVPVNIKNGRNVDSLILKNYKNLQAFMGNGFEKRDRFNGRNIKVTNPKLISSKHDGENPVSSLYVTILDSDKNTKLDEIIIGGEILSECMAFLAEQEFCVQAKITQPCKNDYPYYIVQKLVESIYPELGSYPTLIFSCIDACLFNSFNPGHALYKLICYLRKLRFHENHDKDHILSFFRDQPYNISFEKCTCEAIRLLQHNFQIVELEPTILWLKNIYDRSAFLRNNPFFMDSFVDSTYTGKRFSDIIMQIMGRPIVQNSKYEAQIKLPSNMFDIQTSYKIHLDYISSICSILQVFRVKNAPCIMLDFCKASYKFNKNLKITDVCNNPSEKLNELTKSKTDLCPFAVLWKHWGLSDKKIIRS